MKRGLCCMALLLLFCAPAWAADPQAPAVKAPEVKTPEVKAPVAKVPEVKAPAAPTAKLPEAAPAKPAGVAPQAFAELFFPPVGKLDTPLAKRGTPLEYSELHAWLQGYSKEPGVKLYSLGKSQKGNDIWALRISSPKPRLRMLVMARVHGNEPGASEGQLQFIHSLLRGELKAIRKDMDFLLIPMGNPDGALAGQRHTADGGDINRDYTVTNLVETRHLAAAIRSYDPHLLIDEHEFSVRGRMDGKTLPYDLLAAGGNEPNLPKSLVELTNEVYAAAVHAGMKKAGLRSGPYELVSEDAKTGKLKVQESGTTFASAKNFMALPGRVSFIFEGQRLDASLLNIQRRAYSHYVAVKSAAETAHANADRTKTVLAASRKEIQAQKLWELERKPVIQERLYPLAVAASKSIVDSPALFTNRSAGTAASTAVVPACYVIPANRADLAERLMRMGLKVGKLKMPVPAEAEVQTIQSVSAAGEMYKGSESDRYKGVSMVKIGTGVKREARTFAKGDFVVPANQPGRLYLQTLETASPSGFATLGVLGDKVGMEVPVYRVMKPLPMGSF